MPTYGRARVWPKTAEISSKNHKKIAEKWLKNAKMALRKAQKDFDHFCMCVCVLRPVSLAISGEAGGCPNLLFLRWYLAGILTSPKPPGSVGRSGASRPLGHSLCWDLPRNPAQTSLFPTAMKIARRAHPPPTGADDGSHLHTTSSGEEASCIQHTQDFTQVCTRWRSNLSGLILLPKLGLPRALLLHRTCHRFLSHFVIEKIVDISVTPGIRTQDLPIRRRRLYCCATPSWTTLLYGFNKKNTFFGFSQVTFRLIIRDIKPLCH